MASPRIKELPASERPREKLASLGPGALSDAELLAIFLRTGMPGKCAVTMARDLLRERGSLEALARSTLPELSRQRGIGLAKASQLAAAFELGNRLARERQDGRTVDTPERVYELLGQELRALSQETIRVILLDTRRRLLRVVAVSLGTLNETLAHPREILRPAIAHASHAYILVHNHPSGDPAPSPADRSLTRRLHAASEAVGIPLLDHVIIGAPGGSDAGDAYFSFREAGLL
jgi:DNA repair protein RadC